ncbi:LPO_1073/Vpar_1526 family protein [Roseateles sp. DC23W]|uniref:LPO_1073/Vpar_1526 family protein n=1 Tax=Pelomonas dachongensis TaxID=3299029 RepID=A0ABW7EP83_9BURK
MLGDKQNQSVSEGANAMQAGRDINYHGLSVSEVKELCALFLRDNFPQLREEAKRTAEEHVRVFAQRLEGRLVQDAASIVLDKFREPDVQAAVNDAVKASARKGEKANPQILCTLISERVAKTSNDFKDMVMSEAIEVCARLTSQQIGLISILHAVKSIALKGIPGVEILEGFATGVYESSVGGWGLSQSQKQYLQYMGVASINQFAGGSVFEYKSKEYDFLKLGGEAEFKSVIKLRAPTYFRLLESFDSENLIQIELTSVGQAIAIANLSRRLGSIDYSIWLK